MFIWLSVLHIVLDQTCEKNTSCIYSRIPHDLAYDLDTCLEAYDIPAQDVYEKVAFTNAYYGGKTPKGSKIVFVNGKRFKVLDYERDPGKLINVTLLLKASTSFIENRSISHEIHLLCKRQELLLNFYNVIKIFMHLYSAYECSNTLYNNRSFC